MIKILWLSRYNRLVSDLKFEREANIEAGKLNNELAEKNYGLSTVITAQKAVNAALHAKVEWRNNLIAERSAEIEVALRAKTTAETLLKDSVDSRAELDEWRKRALWEEDENKRLNVILNGYKLLIEIQQTKIRK